MIQSVGVIIAATIIYIKPEWTIADPICTFLFSIMVLMTTVPIFKDCMRHLMETSPDEPESVEIYNTLSALSFVHEIHDFHLWSLSEDKPMFSAHVVVSGDPSHALYQITEILQVQFDIFHSTV